MRVRLFTYPHLLHLFSTIVSLRHSGHLTGRLETPLIFMSSEDLMDIIGSMAFPLKFIVHLPTHFCPINARQVSS